MKGKGYKAQAGTVNRGRRRPYTGRAADVAADIARLSKAGVAHFFLNFPAPTLSEALADLARFAEEVRPLVAVCGRTPQGGRRS